jgi:small subunit ribosomal protein S23
MLRWRSECDPAAHRGELADMGSTIAFVLNLHHTFKKPMSEAYEIAVTQFTDLRARHELATLAAEAESRANGSTFKRDPFVSLFSSPHGLRTDHQERVHAKEEASLSTLATYNTSTTTTTPSAKYKKPRHWSMTVPSSATPSDEFTGGQGYAGMWRLPPPVDVGATISPAEIAGPEKVEQREESPESQYMSPGEEAAFMRQELSRTVLERA